MSGEYPRPVQCPVCGEWCELIETESRRLRRLTLVDIDYRDLSPYNQRHGGRHACGRRGA